MGPGLYDFGHAGMMRTQGCYEGSHFGSEGVEVENGIADTLGSRGG